jgi:hypothetical protein
MKPIPGLDPWRGSGIEKMNAAFYEFSPEKIFEDYVWDKLPVEEISALYSQGGRPAHDLRTYAGLMIFQSMWKLTEFETVKKLADSRFLQKALHIRSWSDDSCFICHRSCQDFLRRVTESEPYKTILDTATAEFDRRFGVDKSVCRVDSMHIHSDMQKLNRGRICFKAIEGFLRKLRRFRAEAFQDLEAGFPELVGRYLKGKKSGYDCFAMATSERRAVLLQTGLEDLDFLIGRFAADPAVSAMESCLLMKRAFSDHGEIAEGEDGSRKIAAKPPKEVSSSSLQNPSDPEAGYSGHKGQGYKACLVENTPDKAGENGNGELRLVLDAKALPANVPDSGTLIPAVDEMKSKGLEVDVVVADMAYGGDDNVQAAAGRGVKVVSPVPDRRAGDEAVNTPPGVVTVADFARGFGWAITACPQGEKAETRVNRKGDGFISEFDVEKCRACPHRGGCPVNVGTAKASLSYTAKQMRIAMRRREQWTEEFRKPCCRRSGIEATNSTLSRRFGIKRLRVRRLKAVGRKVLMAVMCLNITRVASYLRKMAA